MQTIRNGVIDGLGLAGLSGRLGVGVRQLSQVFREEVGTMIHRVNWTRRAHTARMLMDYTNQKLDEIALAAGFGSIRQSDDVVRIGFDASPKGL